MTKKKVKATESKSVDVVEIIEEEEAKRKVGKKKDPTVLKKGTPIKDTTDKLPEHAKSRKIVCRETGEVEVLKVDLSDITATTKSIYVDNIHSANPHILQTIYWIIMKDSRHVVARVTQEEYEYVVGQLKKVNHLVSVVDCAVTPTLTYGSWKLQDLKKELPSPDQIEEEDARFKSNPTGFHNPPILVALKEAEELSAAGVEEDEEWDFDDEDEAEIDENEEITLGDDEEF